MSGPYITNRAAAERLGVHPNTLRNWARSGVISVDLYANGFRKIPLAEVERMEREGGIAMLDLTRYAIVLAGPLTASGQDEIHARTVFKKDCEAILKQSHGGVAKARRRGYEIKRLETP